ncbi:argininosuccinate lyase [Synergistaceae bacterium OttesenSCG-928-I11]|nr:argininosuccinate lyase [Synergistaceae bacterium OttesenSCG-928-I11]
MWKGRFSQDTDERVRRFTQSLDLDWRTVGADVRGSVAHARMLVRAGLLTPEEGETIERALVQIAHEAEEGTFVPSEALEDVHMNVEALLTERTGDVGAKIHTGRSRNDQSNTSVRLALRWEMLRIWDGLHELLDVLATKASEHADTIVPGYTHLQQAQPVSMGHFWMAHWTAFMRDADRLRAAYESVDVCPLGCGALAGSTLPLDRDFTARDLGFSGLCPNSMDAVASRDHLLDFHHFASVFGVHASRISEDLIVYFSSEFGWIKLPDAFCTGSSMMPQKKNPDVLELLRGKSGQLTGALVDTLTLVKGTPLTFNRDFQEDKRALWRSVDAVLGMLDVMPPLFAEVGVDATRARAGFEDGYIFATDVAEYLVERGVPFRKSHEIVGGAVKWCIERGRALTSLTPEEWRTFDPKIGDDLPGLLTPERSAGRRNTTGGASPDQVRLQVEDARKKIAAMGAFFADRKKSYPRMPE